MTKLRVLLADDHPIIREGLRAVINSQLDMEVVGEAKNGSDAVEKATQLLPDVVVMDVSMPILGGAKATEQLKKSHPEIKILALTIHQEEDYLRQLLEAGASGYLLKIAATEDLAHALRTVAAGGTYLDPLLAGKIVKRYLGKPSAREGGTGQELSPREEEVLRLIALGHTNHEVAEQLCIAVKTVETHKYRLMEKLDLHSRADIVRYALRHGWLEDT